MVSLIAEVAPNHLLLGTTESEVAFAQKNPVSLLPEYTVEKMRKGSKTWEGIPETGIEEEQ